MIIDHFMYLVKIRYRVTQIVCGVVEECQHGCSNKFWTIFHQRPRVNYFRFSELSKLYVKAVKHGNLVYFASTPLTST